jgi:FkbM family methyltransferase
MSAGVLTLLRFSRLYAVLLRRFPSAYCFLYLRIYKPLVDRDKVSLLRSLIRTGDTVVDLGANVGFYTEKMCRWVGTSGEVIAFECDPRAYALLERRLASDCAARLTIRREAVSDFEGVAELHMSEMTTDSRLHDTGTAREVVPVPAISLDAALAAHEGSIALIKMDIQGSETLALRGAGRTLSQNPDVVLMLELFPAGLRQAGSSGSELLLTLRALGFRIFLAEHSQLHEHDDAFLLSACGAEGWIDILAARVGNPRLAALDASSFTATVRNYARRNRAL